jgi:hypothetical protein
MSVSVALDAIQDAMESVTRRKWLTTVGLNPAALPARISALEHVQLALHIGTLDDVGAWCRGDQAVIVQNELRARHLSIEKYGEEINKRYMELLKLYRSIELKTLLNNASTARTWPHDTRQQSPTIGYGHHEALNSRSWEERKYYLEMVEANGWTVAQLRAELYGARRPVSPIHNPVSPARIMELFRTMDLPVSIDPNRAVFVTGQGRVIVESNSELVWRIET